MSFVDAKTVHLRGHKDQQHAYWCDYDIPCYDNNEIKEYVKSREAKTVENIEKQMQHILHTYFSAETPTERLFSGSSQHEHKKTNTVVSGTKTRYIHKKVAQQRIDLPFEKDDYNVYKIFYGTVRIEYASKWKEGAKKTYLWLRSPKNRKQCFGVLSLSENVFRFFLQKANKSNCHPGSTVNIAFLSNFHEPTGCGKDSFGYLNHSDDIIFQPV